MSKRLPYTVKTATGDAFDIVFELHSETEDAVKVHQLLSGILGYIDAELKVLGPSSNGDVLQAMAMAFAIRTRMINASPEQLRSISLDLLATNLDTCAQAQRISQPTGHG